MKTRVIAIGLLYVVYGMIWADNYPVASAASDSTVSIQEAAISPLEVCRIGRITKTPLGIVHGSGRELCNLRTNVELKQASLEDALATVLKGTPYVTRRQGQSIDVLPLEETELQKSLLESKLGSFKPRPQPMHEIGAWFDGWLQMATHPGQGWGAVIPGTRDVHDIEFKSEDNDTVSDVLNMLVSKDEGGLWIMQPLQKVNGNVQTSGGSPIVDVFAYRDYEDMLDVLAASCSHK